MCSSARESAEGCDPAGLLGDDAGVVELGRAGRAARCEHSRRVAAELLDASDVEQKPAILRFGHGAAKCGRTDAGGANQKAYATYNQWTWADKAGGR